MPRPEEASRSGADAAHFRAAGCSHSGCQRRFAEPCQFAGLARQGRSARLRGGEWPPLVPVSLLTRLSLLGRVTTRMKKVCLSVFLSFWMDGWSLVNGLVGAHSVKNVKSFYLLFQTMLVPGKTSQFTILEKHIPIAAATLRPK